MTKQILKAKLRRIKTIDKAQLKTWSSIENKPTAAKNKKDAELQDEFSQLLNEVESAIRALSQAEGCTFSDYVASLSLDSSYSGVEIYLAEMGVV